MVLSPSAPQLPVQKPICLSSSAFSTCLEYNVSLSMSQTGLLTHDYTALIGDATIGVAFSFYQNPTTASFGNQSFNITQGITKWTISAVGSWPFGSDVDHFTVSTNLTANLNLDQIHQEHNEPAENMTTYTWSSSTNNIAVKMELFDFAFADDQQVKVFHSLDQEGGIATLRITFSRFTSNLTYDPAMGLTTVIAGSNNGGFSTTLVVAISVAVPCALVAVVVIGLLILVPSIRRFTRNRNKGLAFVHYSLPQSSTL